MPRQALIGVLLLALLAGATSLPGGAKAAEETATPAKTPAANVQILPAALTPEPMKDGAIRIRLVAVNQGAERAQVWFRPVLVDGSGAAAPFTVTGLWRPGTEDWIRAGEVVPFTLVLRPGGRDYSPWWDPRLPLKGHLAIETTTESGNDVKTKKVELRELSVSQVQPAVLESAVVVIAVLSVVLLLVSLWASNGEMPTGAGSWSTDSIGANVAIGAGLVTGLSAITGLPQLTIYASRPTYGILIAIFAAIVALASPVANLVSKILPKPALFVAATLVLWGATGQFLIVLLLVLELRHAAVIGGAVAWTLGTLDIILALAVVAYVCHAVARPGTRKAADGSGVAAAAARTASVGSDWIVP